MSPTKTLERQAAEREAEAEREKEQLRESRRIGGLPEDDDTDGEEAARPAPALRKQPKPKAPKPPATPTAPGTQGGTSAKPIGRKRDQQP